MRRVIYAARLGFIGVLGISTLGFAIGIAPASIPKIQNPAPVKGAVEGTVLDPNGNPAASIVVKFTVKKGAQVGNGNLSICPGNQTPLPMGPRSDRTVGTTRTDANGRYTYAIDPGNYKLIVARKEETGEAYVFVESNKVLTMNNQMRKR